MNAAGNSAAVGFMFFFVCVNRKAMAEAVQNHVKSLNWGHRVQLQDRYRNSQYPVAM